ncbi:Translin [Polychaeton citri CBS 116435]|uniref:Translin n=1 Tax=Polychaeton citri CBS 116435 TaxID=1314669 RepID=A0A9P4Q507_9PEZI|nr:Translin [Polychaeton citri CBS 116435]
MGQKRPFSEMEGKDSKLASASPFMPVFEIFKAELDEHHERRERTIKASRDITAASKKIIFTLQRIRKIAQPLPAHVEKENTKHWDTIRTSLAAVSKDLQGINADRYARNISGGCQEWMEAASFQHYLVTGTLISLEEAAAQLRALDSEGPGVRLTHEDYLLGIYDMTGELMRFAITAMATSGALPVSGAPAAKGDDGGAKVAPTGDRNVLTDLRALRAVLESLEVGAGGPFARDVEKKSDVMRASVEKVEKALYGLVVRGAERPKGWMPDLSAGGGGRGPVEVEG